MIKYFRCNSNKYNLMKQIISLVLLFVCFIGSLSCQNTNLLYDIPVQRLNLNKIVGINNPQINTISPFSVSHLVSLKEYKEFLMEMKRDSGDVCYYRLCPDSSITSAEKLNQYLSDTIFDQFPV